MVEVEHAFDVLLAHGRKDERADDGEADLAAVGVSGEHEVDEREAGVEDDVFDVVGLVAHEDHRSAGVSGDRKVEVGSASSGVIGAAEPEKVAATFKGEIAVDEDGSSVGFDRADDVVGAHVDVMVAEDAEALRSFEGGEDFCSDAGGLPGNLESKRAAADKVAGNEDEIRGKRVDLRHHVFEEVRLGELLEVNIAHLNDAEVFEGVGERADRDGESCDLELVARVGSGINADAQACGRKSRPEKAAAGDMK